MGQVYKSLSTQRVSVDYHTLNYYSHAANTFLFYTIYPY